MEKLLEQEALMEQQDPKVRCARLLRWPPRREALMAPQRQAEETGRKPDLERILTNSL